MTQAVYLAPGNHLSSSFETIQTAPECTRSSRFDHRRLFAQNRANNSQDISHKIISANLLLLFINNHGSEQIRVYSFRSLSELQTPLLLAHCTLYHVFSNKYFQNMQIFLGFIITKLPCLRKKEEASPVWLSRRLLSLLALMDPRIFSAAERLSG